jgi:hypothetical protein
VYLLEGKIDDNSRQECEERKERYRLEGDQGDSVAILDHPGPLWCGFIWTKTWMLRIIWFYGWKMIDISLW